MPVTIYDFFADWCGPCKVQDEILEEFEEGHKNITVERVDVEEKTEMATEYNVRSLPTLVVEVNGEPKERFIGVTDKEKLEGAVDKYI